MTADRTLGLLVLISFFTIQAAALEVILDASEYEGRAVSLNERFKP